MPSNVLELRYLVLAPAYKGKLPTTKATGPKWESLVDQLHQTEDPDKIRELVTLLEEAIFNRQQELAVNADKIDRREVEQEERRLRQALDLMLELKTKRLGFPEIR